MFEVGDKVAYPMHGAGVIKAIEERCVAGYVTKYYVLLFEMGGMKVMVPMDNSNDSGLRSIIDEKECDKLIAYMKNGQNEEDNNWNRRYRENLERIKTGNVYDVADVVCTLTSREKDKGLSTGDRKMLITAKQILISEIMLSSNKNEKEVSSLIESILNS